MGDSGEASGGGRDPFGPVRWDLVPGRTAVVLIDLQRDFLHPDGWYAQSGVDIGHMRRVIEPTHELVRAARAAGAPLIWTRHGFRGAEDGGPFFELRPFLRRGRPAPRHLGLRPARRPRRAARGLDRREEPPQRLLQHQARARAARPQGRDGAGHGVLTNQCVAATSKDAMFRDFKTIVVEECTGTTLPTCTSRPWR